MEGGGGRGAEWRDKSEVGMRASSRVSLQRCDAEEQMRPTDLQYTHTWTQMRPVTGKN